MRSELSTPAFHGHAVSAGQQLNHEATCPYS